MITTILREGESVSAVELVNRIQDVATPEAVIRFEQRQAGYDHVTVLIVEYVCNICKMVKTLETPEAGGCTGMPPSIKIPQNFEEVKAEVKETLAAITTLAGLEAFRSEWLGIRGRVRTAFALVSGVPGCVGVLNDFRNWIIDAYEKRGYEIGGK